jgi:hypothetical protein
MKKGLNRPKRLSFFDNYKALVTVAAFIILSFSAGAQIVPYDSTRNRTDVNTYGSNFLGNYLIGNSIVLPHDTVKLARRDSGAMAFRGGVFYGYNGYKWTAFAGGIPTLDTTAKWINSIYRKPGKDSIYFNIGGVEYKIKDSTGGSGGAPDTIKAKSPLYVITGGTYDSLAIKWASRLQEGALSDTGYKHFDSAYKSVVALNDSTLRFTRSDGNTTDVTVRGVGGTSPTDTTSLSNRINLKADKATTITINGTTQNLSANRTWTVGTLVSSDTVYLHTKIISDSTVLKGYIDLKENSFTETKEEFTGSTSLTVTASHTPLTTKARLAYFNGILIDDSNISISGTSFTISGITRETSDKIKIIYSY